MDILKEDFLNFKDLRESKIRTLITDLSKRGRGINKSDLLKKLKKRKATELKNSNFFQILDAVVDQNIEKMNSVDESRKLGPMRAWEGAQDNLMYGGAENSNDFTILTDRPTPTAEEDSFLHSTIFSKISHNPNITNFVDFIDHSDFSYSNINKNIMFQYNSFEPNLKIRIDDEYEEFFYYTRIMIDEIYFFGYKTFSTDLYLIPLSFGWIFFKIENDKSHLLAYLKKENPRSESWMPLGNTEREWKLIKMNHTFTISTGFFDLPIEITPNTIDRIDSSILDYWERIPNLPKFLTVVINDQALHFRYQKIDNFNSPTYGYVCDYMDEDYFILSNNNIFYLFVFPKDFDYSLTNYINPKIVIHTSNISHSPLDNNLGYNLDFKTGDLFEYRDPDNIDYRITNVHIGKKDKDGEFHIEVPEDINYELLKDKIIYMCESATLNDVLNILESNQYHFQGTNLKVFFDVIFNVDGEPQGERYYFRKINFFLDNLDADETTTCYCYVNSSTITNITKDNAKDYSYVLLILDTWVKVNIEIYQDQQYQTDQLNISPTHISKNGTHANFDFNEWIKVKPDDIDFKPLLPEENILFNYKHIYQSASMPNVYSPEILELYGRDLAAENEAEAERNLNIREEKKNKNLDSCFPPTEEEDQFLYSSGLIKLTSDQYDSLNFFLDMENGMFHRDNKIEMEKFNSKTLELVFDNDLKVELFYGRLLIKGHYFYGYKSINKICLIPLKLGWILLKEEPKTNDIILLGYCEKDMSESTNHPLGSTEDIWKLVMITNNFSIKIPREEGNILVKKRKNVKIDGEKLTESEIIPNLPRVITFLLVDGQRLFFIYQKIVLGPRSTWGYKYTSEEKNMYLLSYKNSFYLFDNTTRSFPDILQSQVAFSVTNQHPDYSNFVIGYEIDFEGGEFLNYHRNCDIEIVDILPGGKVSVLNYEQTENEDLKIEIQEYLNRLCDEEERTPGNLAELFKENQFTYDGTNLKKHVDFIFRGYRRLGKRFYMKRIKFILGGNERDYICYCYTDKPDLEILGGDNINLPTFIFLVKNHWVMLRFSDMFRDGLIHINKATPLYICNTNYQEECGFSYEKWIEIEGDYTLGQAEPMRNSTVGVFRYEDIIDKTMPLETITSPEILELYGYDEDMSSNNFSYSPQNNLNSGNKISQEKIPEKLESYIDYGESDERDKNIFEEDETREQALERVTVYKKDYATDKNKDLFNLLQYISIIFDFEGNNIGLKNLTTHFDEEAFISILKKITIGSVVFQALDDTEMGIDAGGLRPEFFRDIISEYKKTFLQIISDKDDREAKDMAKFMKLEQYVEKKLREKRITYKQTKKQTLNNTARVNTNNFFRSQKTRDMYQNIVRTKLANNRRDKQDGKPLTKTQRKIIREKVDKRMKKYNRNVRSLSRKMKKSSSKPERTLSAPDRVNYGNNRNNFTQSCDLEATNFIVRKFKNNSFKKFGIPIELSYFIGGIFLGKIISNDNGHGEESLVKIFPNIQMSYYFMYRLIKDEDYLNSWLDLLSLCKLDMPDIYDSFKFWDESWNDMSYTVWDDDLPIPKEYYKYLGGVKEFQQIKKEMKKFGKNNRLNSYVPDPKLKLSLFLLYVIEKYERGLEEEYFYFIRGMKSILNLDIELLNSVSVIDYMFTGGSIDVELLISKTDIVDYGHSSVTEEELENIETWFSEMLREMDIAEDSEFLKKLLYFWSSSYNVSETKRYSINVMDKELGDDSLPTSHTCSMELDIHKYSSKDIMIEKLKISVLGGQEGFGFA